MQENPTGRNVEAGVAAFNDHRADGIIALGGGSGLDCAKTIAILAACGGPLWRFAWPDHEAAQAEPGRFPIIAIPTTAGTGAEVEPAPSSPTASAGEARHPASRHAAESGDRRSRPDRQPAGQAHRRHGMDALSHNLEALCVASYHPMADAIAASAIALIGRWLPVAVAEPGNIEARSHMMAAAIMGATAFGKGLGAMRSSATPSAR